MGLGGHPPCSATLICFKRLSPSPLRLDKTGLARVPIELSSSERRSLLISARPHRRNPLATVLYNNRWLVLTAVMLALLPACSSVPNEKGPSTPVSSSFTPSSGFTNFETEPVSPLVLSADGRYLYALNTADDRLEVFTAQGETLSSLAETTVGLRPVALALHGNEVWVVNHLSDSVSVVDVSNPSRPRVTHTLQVGDEPRGIVIAGPKARSCFSGYGQAWREPYSRRRSSSDLDIRSGTTRNATQSFDFIWHQAQSTSGVSGRALRVRRRISLGQRYRHSLR